MAKKKTKKTTAKKKTTTKKNGRPSKFKPEFIKQVEKICRLGATDEDLADFFGVATSTISNWKKIEEFKAAMDRGKLLADVEVAESLYRRAIGYTHDEEKIFCNEGEIVRAQTKKHYPPNVTAQIFWLKNRHGKKWRDKHEHEHSGSVDGFSDIERVNRVTALLDAARTRRTGQDTEENNADMGSEPGAADGGAEE